MTFEEMVDILQQAGYTVVAPPTSRNKYVQAYYDNGEFWENNPKAYTRMTIDEQDKYEDAMMEVDWDEVVKTWDKRTLWTVKHSGSDLGFTKPAAWVVTQAATREFDHRFKGIPRDRLAHNGQLVN